MTFITELRKVNTNAVKGKRNQNTAILGPSGIGKSYAALRLSEMYYNEFLDDDFNVDNVVFTISEFLERVNVLNECGIIIFDDAGLKYSSAEWWSELNKILGFTLQSYRYRIINVFFTLPNKKWLDRIGRGMLHGQIVMKRPGLGRYIKIQHNPTFDKDYHKNRPPIVFDLPSNNLTTEYELKKDNYLRLEYQFYLEQAHLKEASRKPNNFIIKEIFNDYNEYCFNGRLSWKLIKSKLFISDQRAQTIRQVILKDHNPGGLK